MNLSDAIAPLFGPVRSGCARLGTASRRRTGQKAFYGLPIGRTTNHIHVWKSLLERAGFTLADIPKEWETFWAFWCDRVQPAVREAMGRDDIWGIGLNMSGEHTESSWQFFQFMAAYEADYAGPCSSAAAACVGRAQA